MNANHETESGSGERVSSTASAHSPSPWHVSPNKPSKTRGIDIIGPNMRSIVASVYFPHASWQSEEFRERARANARLIASAPVMLAALRQVLAYTDSSTDPAIVSTCKTAIAKATGAA